MQNYGYIWVVHFGSPCQISKSFSQFSIQAAGTLRYEQVSGIGQMGSLSAWAQLHFLEIFRTSWDPVVLPPVNSKGPGFFEKSHPCKNSDIGKNVTFHRKKARYEFLKGHQAQKFSLFIGTQTNEGRVQCQ